jgi:hypothetical protein
MRARSRSDKSIGMNGRPKLGIQEGGRNDGFWVIPDVARIAQRTQDAFSNGRRETAIQPNYQKLVSRDRREAADKQTGENSPTLSTQNQ